MQSTATLPDDPALLKARLAEREAEIERLKFIIAKLRRAHFGRRSEQMDGVAEQFLLGLNEEAVTCAGAEPALAESKAPAATKRSGRRPLPVLARDENSPVSVGSAH